MSTDYNDGGTDDGQVRLTDSQAEHDACNEESAMAENTETEAMKENAPVETPSRVDAPIEYMLNPVNKKVFEVNDDLVKRKDLVPCTKDGKRVPDHRILGRFNS